jgi:hypothetical protein
LAQKCSLFAASAASIVAFVSVGLAQQQQCKVLPETLKSTIKKLLTKKLENKLKVYTHSSASRIIKPGVPSASDSQTNRVNIQVDRSSHIIDIRCDAPRQGLPEQ